MVFGLLPHPTAIYSAELTQPLQQGADDPQGPSSQLPLENSPASQPTPKNTSTRSETREWDPFRIWLSNNHILSTWPGPDGAGYSGALCTYTWVDLLSTGTPITFTTGNADDGYTPPINLGFEFPFYNSSYTQTYASSNGLLSFGAGSTFNTNQCPLPDGSNPNNIIPIMWDDLDFNLSGQIYYQNYSTCPLGTGACTIVEYHDTAYYDEISPLPGSAGTWEAILYEDGTVKIQVLNSGVNMGKGSTTGIEGTQAGNNHGLTYACNQATSIPNTLCVQFNRPVRPNLNTSQMMVPALVQPNQPLTYTLVLRNSGSEAATPLSIRNPIPAGTTFAASLSAGLTYNSAQNRVEWTGTLSGLHAISLTFVLTAGTVCGGAITNTTIISTPQLPSQLSLVANTDVWSISTLSADFEDNNGGFIPDPGSDWQWGIPTYPLDLRPHSGQKVWGTNLSGPANDNSINHNLTVTIQVPDVPDVPIQLVWWDWFGTDGGDTRRVHINGAAYWVDNSGLEQRYWARHTLDLTAWRGQTIDLRFVMFGCCSAPGPDGYYLDDISIVACPTPQGIYLSPDRIETEGCPETPQPIEMALYNVTAVTRTYNLTYTLQHPNHGTLTGPSQLTVPGSEKITFTAVLTPQLCLPEGAHLLGTVAAGSGIYSTSASLDHTIVMTSICPSCSQRGWLQGRVFDFDGVTPPPQPATVHIEPGDLDIEVLPSGAYSTTLIPFDSYHVTALGTNYRYPIGPYTLTVYNNNITNQNFSLNRADINASPLKITTTLIAPGTTVRTITLTNQGNLSLTYKINEVPPAVPVQSNQITTLSKTGPLEIDPRLSDHMTTQGHDGYLIYLRPYPDLSPAYQMDWNERGRFVASALQKVAEESQTALKAYLDKRNVSYRAFWVDNVIVVQDSSKAVFEELKAFPEIKLLQTLPHPQLMDAEETKTPTRTLLPTSIEPNLTHINVDQVWAQGIDGQGIVVANIDSGVRYTHLALVSQYRGNLGNDTFDNNYNWWDPAPGGGSRAPEDPDGHGSHTMGIIVGDDNGANKIGVAPGAQWIACKTFETLDEDYTISLLECGQFMVAPWNLNGTNPDSDKRPHIVNNSWGDCGFTYNNWYDGILNSWLASGIYPIFANGNASNCGYDTPPGLNTVTTPARSGKVTAVGSTGLNNGLYAPHSTWGPTDNPDLINPRGHADLKPQVVAPGVGIRSAMRDSDTAYIYLSGTSMSAPHVAGLVALMWEAAPCLLGDYANTETIIEQTATPIAYNDGYGARVPNYATGWGEINALKAVNEAKRFCAGISWMEVTPISSTIPTSGNRVVTVTLTCNLTDTTPTQPLQGSLSIQHNDPTVSTLNIPVELTCANPVLTPRWNKEVWINGVKATSFNTPYAVHAGDLITVVEALGASYSGPISAVLTQSWEPGLQLKSYSQPSAGTIITGTDRLTWTLNNVTPNISHLLTKTYQARYSSWTTATLSEQYTVTGATQPITDLRVTFVQHFPPVTLTKTGPITAELGSIVPVQLVISSDGAFLKSAWLTDTLPPEMTYVGGLRTSFGETRVETNTIYWDNLPQSTIMVGVVSPDPEVDDLLEYLNEIENVNARRVSASLYTLTLEDLRPYAIIVVCNNARWDPANPLVADVLADYIDNGGKLIISNLAWDYTGLGLRGRLISGGYTPYMTATANLNATSLGEFNANHPVMAGIGITNSLSTATHENLVLTNGATYIARWADGQPLVYAQGENVLGYNFRLDWTREGNPWSGEVPQLLENSIRWLVRNQRTPLPTTVTTTFNVRINTMPASRNIQNSARLSWDSDYASAIHDMAITVSYVYLPIVLRKG